MADPRTPPATPGDWLEFVLVAVFMALFIVLIAGQARGGDPPPAGTFVARPDPVSPAGVRATADLPATRHLQNTGGSDRAGLCVPTSVVHGADWGQVPEMADFRKFTERRPGGSYPEKLDRDITVYCAGKGVPVPAYVQHTGGDLEFLRLTLKTGRMPCVTYAGADGFYGGPIAHMVNLVHLDDACACIVDNNRPGRFVWMTSREFENRWLGLYDTGRPMVIREGVRTFQVGGGWAFVWLAPPPPPYAVTAGVAAAPVAPTGLPPLANFGVDPGKLPPAVAPAGTNFGVDPEKVKVVKSYALNGTDVSRAVAAAALADDSDKMSVTCVGTPVPALSELVKSKAHVQRYEPGDWEVAQFGLTPGATVRAAAAGRVGRTVGVIAPEKVTAAAIADLVLGAPPANPDPVTPAGPAGPAKLNLKPGDVVPPGVTITVEIDAPAPQPAPVVPPAPVIPAGPTISAGRVKTLFVDQGAVSLTLGSGEEFSFGADVPVTLDAATVAPADLKRVFAVTLTAAVKHEFACGVRVLEVAFRRDKPAAAAIPKSMPAYPKPVEWGDRGEWRGDHWEYDGLIPGLPAAPPAMNYGPAAAQTCPNGRCPKR